MLSFSSCASAGTPEASIIDKAPIQHDQPALDRLYANMENSFRRKNYDCAQSGKKLRTDPTDSIRTRGNDLHLVDWHDHLPTVTQIERNPLPLFVHVMAEPRQRVADILRQS